ncbi:sec7 domain containing [Cryptosporidium bovis]|uniref:sec7 domain containing n=1 Tax=Cryptosporidium bovis TaxID=310047 RepID=UPI00351A33E0|nr:sec7 domain containing [Cryptosporidium bovis]
MTDIERQFNTTWVSRKDSPNEIDSGQNITLLRCIKTEIRNIITSLKLYKHGTDSSRYNKEVIENLDFSVTYQFQSLLENVLVSNKFTIEYGRLDPFLEVIQSPEFGGNITASVLNAIDQFVFHGIIYIDDANKHSSTNKLIESILNCRFTASGIESDEIALQKLLNLLVNVVDSEFGEFISSENLIKCVLKCFQISRQPRSTLLLRSFGESSIQKLIISILSRLGRKQISEKEDCSVTLIRIINFLSMLSFYGLQLTQYNASKIRDTKKEEVLKIIKKTIQMDGLDSSSTLEIRRMGLNLLNIAIESGGEQLSRFPEFLLLIQELCINLLLFSLRELSMLQFTFRCLFTIFSNFRSHIKLQMELCLTTLHIRIANSGINKIDLIPINIQDFCFSLEQRELALNSLIEISKDPPFVCEIFQNYDCNIYCGNVFQAIARTFVNQFKFEYKHQSKKSNKTTKTLTIFQRLGFNGLMNVLKGIYTEIKNIHKNFSTNNDKTSDEINFQLFLLKQKNIKVNLIKCCDLFNEDPTNFLEKFNEIGIFNSTITPIELAKFFRYAPNIDYCILGEYLSKNKDWNGSVRSAFMSTFDFSGKTVVMSLREVLGTFKLPGESQQIERIMESFSHEFFSQQKIINDCDSNNTDFGINNNTPRIINIFEDGCNEKKSIVLDNSDTIFILSYSIIMLNTDLHNVQVKHKMTVDDFIKNNRGINNGSDLPREFLVSIFDEIKHNGIKLHENHGLIGKQNSRQGSNIDTGIWDTWLKKHSLNKVSLDFCDGEIKKEVTCISIYEEMLNILIEMGLVECIINCFENSSDIQMLFKCINGILELVHLCHIFSKNNVINDLIERISKFINLELSAKSQLIIPIFLHIVRITINKWDKDSPWHTLFTVLFMLNSLKLFPQKYIEFEELTDNQGKVISSYSNIQYPRLCFTTRTMTFGITNGFEYFVELAKSANKNNVERNLDQPGSNSSLKINKNSFSWSERFIRSSSLNNSNWLGDITNILFRSIEEDDEENIKFASEPPKIFDSIIQFIIEEDTMFPSRYYGKDIPTPSEIILSWIINGSSPYLAISIYSIIINSIIWEVDVLPIISYKSRLIDSKITNSNMPSISTGNSWEMLSHYISESQKIYNILINGLKSIKIEDCRKIIDVLMEIVDQFPFSERNINNSNTATLNTSTISQNVGSENNQNIEQEIFYLDWGPLLITEKKKILNFRKISDPLISIGIIMSIVIINISDNSQREVANDNEFLTSSVWEEVFSFFQKNMMRYSIFTCFNKLDNMDKVQTNQSVIKDLEGTQEFPRSLSRSDYMFAERIITNSLVLLIHLSRVQSVQSQKLTSILQLLLQLHPIIFSLNSEKIIATIQIIMRTEKKAQLIESDKTTVSNSGDWFPSEDSILLMLGILQRMVYVPPISSLENIHKIPEFYPGKLSDPQILVLSSLECIGMWLYNPKYSSLLFNNISLIIQTLITFAIFTPTTLNGRVVFSPLENESNVEHNYDANLQAISLTFSLLSVFTNQDSKVLITQVVHTLCIAASFGPNTVRNHTMNRIQQTLGSLHLDSFWFISDPWIWFELIDSCFIPLITFDFRFPFYNSLDVEDDNTSLLLSQYFTPTVAQLVLGADTVYNRQVHSVTIVSKIILTRIDLLLEPLEFSNKNQLESKICDVKSDEEHSNKRFLLLVPVLIIFVNVLVQNTAGNSSVFFSETLKNIILVVLSTNINASYDVLVTNAVNYLQKLGVKHCETDLVSILENSAEGDIFWIIKSIVDFLVRPTLPDIASEIIGVVEDIHAQVNSIESNGVLVHKES